MPKKLISIVSPVLNEEKSLPLFTQTLWLVLTDLKNKYDFEVIFVDDGSKDKSSEILEKMMARLPEVKCLEFSRNFGKEIALSAGINHAKGQAVITLDADLQHPPRLIPEFLQRWEKGAEVVIGLRQKTQKESLTKRLGSALFYRLMRLIGETEVLAGETDFRLIDRSVAEEFNRFTERGRLTRGLIDWLGFKRDTVFFEAPERRFGRPGYGLGQLVRLGLASCVSHSLFPLKLAGYLGLLITLSSGFLGFFMFLNRYLIHDPFNLAFSNIAMLAVFILFLIGIVLVCLGLMALYIANIHLEVTNRPIYVIRKKRNF